MVGRGPTLPRVTEGFRVDSQVDITPDTLWIRGGRALVGLGPSLILDPGTGPGRYQRALTALRESGRKRAMASFTFDPDEPGSVVVVPTEFVEIPADELTSSEFPTHGRVVSDGTTAWRRAMPRALESISANTVQKVVVTRQVDVVFDSKVAIGAVVDRLRTTEPRSFTFMVSGLIGASPELLVSLEDGRISSLVLAGTALDPDNLKSDKMDREHSLSLASVEDGVSPHTISLNVEQRQVLEFGDLNHLATRVSGQAVTGTTVLDVLSSLHPTAAVAGRPSDTALKVIKELELRSRGRYAGPVGWFNLEGEGEFAIALRCGLIDNDKATLYAGGGIVRGSDADSEFAETELKLRPMLNALGLD